MKAMMKMLFPTLVHLLAKQSMVLRTLIPLTVLLRDGKQGKFAKKIPCIQGIGNFLVVRSGKNQGISK